MFVICKSSQFGTVKNQLFWEEVWHNRIYFQRSQASNTIQFGHFYISDKQEICEFSLSEYTTLSKDAEYKNEPSQETGSR